MRAHTSYTETTTNQILNLVRQLAKGCKVNFVLHMLHKR